MTRDDLIARLDSYSALWLTIAGEARGECLLGQIAVGCVIRNRSIQQHKPVKNICLAPYQFSCWNENDPNLNYLIDFVEHPLLVHKDEAIINQIKFITSGILANQLLDVTGGAKHYVTVALSKSMDAPVWVKTAKPTVTIGNHVFLICD